MSEASSRDAAAQQRAALIADALAGLAAPRKTLPCKWLYDAEGCRLFEEITRLPEYYPTRTEVKILTEQAPAIAAAVGPGRAVVEFGPGDGAKAALLLGGLEAPAAYVPVDIAPRMAGWRRHPRRRGASRAAGAARGRRFHQPLRPARRIGTAPRLGFFPGSTMGNFEPEGAVAFLRRALATLGAGSRMLLGADLAKGQAVLEAAYDDAAGVTAAFDLNLLHRLNREAGADFDVPAFRHRAVWNPALERVEMHLVAQRAQAVHLAGRTSASPPARPSTPRAATNTAPSGCPNWPPRPAGGRRGCGPIRRRCSRSGC